MRACFIDDEVNAVCAVGNRSIEAIGAAVDIVRSVARRVSLTLVEACIRSLDDAAGCDVVAGSLRQAQVYASRGWTSSGAYDADSVAVMFEPVSSIDPWSFLLPFAPALWAVIAILAFVVTPLVSSAVEYDEGETVAKNFRTYLPDSVHAYTGVDALKRTGSEYSQESAVLSAVVAVVGRILIALYSCNLAAYVIASYMHVPPTSEMAARALALGTVAFSPGFFFKIGVVLADVVLVDVVLADVVLAETAHRGLRMYRDRAARAFVAGETYLRSVQTCGDVVHSLHGSHIFNAMALSSNFSRAAEFDAELRKRVLEFPSMAAGALRCPKAARGIGLEGTYGVFIAFGACIATVSIASVMAHAFRHAARRHAGRRHAARRRVTRDPEAR